MKLPGTIVMASGNPGKAKEISALLAHLDVMVVPQSEYGVSAADETGSTFEENAVIKARHAATATGLPAIADGLPSVRVKDRSSVGRGRSGPGNTD